MKPDSAWLHRAQSHALSERELASGEERVRLAIDDENGYWRSPGARLWAIAVRGALAGYR